MPAYCYSNHYHLKSYTIATCILCCQNCVLVYIAIFFNLASFKFEDLEPWPLNVTSPQRHKPSLRWLIESLVACDFKLREGLAWLGHYRWGTFPPLPSVECTCCTLRWVTGSSQWRSFLQLVTLLSQTLALHFAVLLLICISCPSKATSNQTNWRHLSMQHINFMQNDFA